MRPESSGRFNGELCKSVYQGCPPLSTNEVTEGELMLMWINDDSHVYLPYMEEISPMVGWGRTLPSGVEIWDTTPVFCHDLVTLADRLRLLFYPKKFLLYRYIKKAKQKKQKAVFRILDVGCGTGASVIDLKKLFGRSVDVVGVDVVELQVELAQKKAKQYGVVATFVSYDGMHLPFADGSFDAIYTSDVLGHVTDVPAWLAELSRVLVPGGALAMFTESALGRHAWIRRYLLRRGLNVDPHAAFHISLHTKQELSTLVSSGGFDIRSMVSVFWPAFFLHPEEFYPALQTQKNFSILRLLNTILTWCKKRTHPYSAAAAELYGLLEMVTIGRWVESQGYIILACKREQ